MLSIPSWLTVLALAMSPIFELRGAIPLAISFYGYSPLEAFFLSVMGNLLPVVPLLLYMDSLSRMLMRHPLGDKFFTWLFSRTRRKYLQDHENFGLTALMLFVAVPLPMTGAWTGCLVAFLLGFRFWGAFAAIAAGVLIAGLVVTATVVGVQSMIEYII